MMVGGIKGVYLMKKYRIKLITLIALSVFIAKPLIAQVEYKANAKEYYQSIVELPQPDSGITIVSGISKAIPKAFQEEEKKRRGQQKAQGFSFSNSSHSKRLIDLSNGIGIKKDIFLNDVAPKSTDIKKSLTQLSLAFSYSGINDESVEHIGFSAIGAWDYLGWTGVIEYFKTKDLGVCQLSVNNVELSHGAIELDSHVISYEVNNKVTTSYVKGSKESGFIYTVSWYDKTYFRDLECSKKSFDKENISKMLVFANRIDV